MPDRPTTTGRRRRSLLAGLGTGIAATAGCLTTLPSFGQTVRFGEVDEPTADGPTYRDWIPDDLGAADPPGSPYIESHRPGRRGENTIGAPYQDQWIKSRLDHVGVDFQSFEEVVTVGNATVARGSIDRGHVEETLAQTGYEPDGTYEGFDLYARASPGSLPEGTVAVGDDVAVFSRHGSAAGEHVIDTGAGRQTRRHEASDVFERLTDEVGSLPVTNVAGGRSDHDGSGTVAGATGATFDDANAYFVRTRIYGDESEVDRDEIESDIESSTRALDATRVDVRIDGRLVSIVAEFDHETFADLLGPLFAYPLITWGFDYDANSETLILTHEAGDAIDASRLTLLDTATAANDPADVQFADHAETIAPGDSLRVDVSGRDEWHYNLAGTVPGTDEQWTEFNVGDAWFDQS